jgi:alkanesulfonate monooxygenase SsuD/methylene tetrahydromethanopterin reductase-like flavin-dependent oxidoreductase (luciferase family)
MELGVHLPLLELGDEGQSLARLQAAVDTARESGFAAIAANDHFVFQRPWLDGPTALAAVIERSGELELATTIALVSLRGPVQLAKALDALDVLSGGRVVAGVGPGSSERDYELAGVPFEERWKRFDEAVERLRELVRVPVWIGSWGSEPAMRRVARLGDGWLASAYNTTPRRFAAAGELLPPSFPSALASMWTWVTESRSERDRVLADVLAPMLRRDADDLREQVCVGPAEHCAELLAAYARAGCGRVYLWPLGDEPRQLELVAAEVAPRIAEASLT